MKLVVFKVSQEQVPQDFKFLLTANQTLTYGKWNELKMNDACPLISTWRTENLSIYGNQRPQILREISSIQFPNLKTIDMNDNKIQSIQIISRLWIPSLRTVWSRNNNLTSIKEFRKSNFPDLQCLSFSGNYLKEGTQLSCLESDKMNFFAFEYGDTKQVLIYDLRCICKMVSRKISTLYIQSRKRIMEKSLKQWISKRHSNLKSF